MCLSPGRFIPIGSIIGGNSGYNFTKMTAAIFRRLREIIWGCYGKDFNCTKCGKCVNFPWCRRIQLGILSSACTYVPDISCLDKDCGTLIGCVQSSNFDMLTSAEDKEMLLKALLRKEDSNGMSCPDCFDKSRVTLHDLLNQCIPELEGKGGDTGLHNN